MVVGHVYVPAAGWGLTRDGDVAAEADQHATARHDVRRSFGGEVRGEGFAGRAEVELDPARDDDGASRLAEANRPPTRDPVRDEIHRHAVAGDGSEIGVVAGQSHRGPHRRVDGAVRQLGAAQRG